MIKKEKNRLRVYLTQPPDKGLANAQLIDLLSKHFKFKKYQFKIIKGLHSRDKVVEILDV